MQVQAALSIYRQKTSSDSRSHDSTYSPTVSMSRGSRHGSLASSVEPHWEIALVLVSDNTVFCRLDAAGGFWRQVPARVVRAETRDLNSIGENTATGTETLAIRRGGSTCRSRWSRWVRQTRQGVEGTPHALNSSRLRPRAEYAPG